MAWIEFNPEKPDGEDGGTDVIADIRNNQNAEYCWSIVRGGGRGGFARTTNANGTSIPFSRPTEVYYRRGAAATVGSVWIRVELVWGTSGGANGNVTQATYFYSDNGGTSYDKMTDNGFNRATYTYNSDGTPVATSFPTWSLSP